MKLSALALILLPSFALAQVDSSWAQAQHVFVGKLTAALPGPVAQSMPPIYNHTLKITVEKTLRGDLKPGDLSAHHAARQINEPVFPLGKSCIMAASSARGGLTVTRILEATPEHLEQITLACSMPMGWSVADGKPLSPWANLGAAAWSADAKDPAAKIVCAQTGRPAYLAGEATFTVEKVPPAKEIQWTNPDGDGEYKITVTNNTDKPITVPALLSADGKVLWEESLVILCQKKTYLCPGSKGVTRKVTATTLQPKESVSTTVNALRLEGPEWPRGGYRIEFQFCLGEKSNTQSLYYMSRHHDPLRAAAKKG